MFIFTSTKISVMFFFTDLSKITSQPISYGPVSGHARTQYAITAPFEVTDNPKAFACADAMMLILPSTDQNLVNAVLKPSAGLDIPFSTIRYYIYRGLAKDTFISGAAIRNDATTNSDFIKKIWADYAVSLAADNTLPPPTPAAFGYTDQLPATFSAEEVFNDQSAAAVIRPVYIKEGTWFGNFGDNAGFEIITDTDNMPADLAFISSLATTFDIGSLTGGSPEKDFVLLTAKEKILNFIDPAAFWGLHFSTGISIYDTTASGSKKKIKKDDIYNTLLAKTTTKNRVYIDIRSERGYSYNYYGNYGGGDQDKIIKLNAAAEQPYHVNGWPLFYTDDALGTKTETKIKLNIRTDDNDKPLLCLEDTSWLGSKNKNRFISDTQLLDSGTWSKEFALQFPNVSGGAARVNIAYCLKMQYFRQNVNAASPAPVWKSSNFMDSVFGNINIPLPGANPFMQQINVKRHFINHPDYAYVAESGIYYDAATVLLYSKAKYIYKAPANPGAPYADIQSNNPGMVSSTISPKGILFNKFKIKETDSGTGTVTETAVLDIVAFRSEEDLNAREFIYLLGLTKNEFGLLTGFAGIETTAAKYVTFTELLSSTNTPLQDDDSKHFKRFSIEVTGYDTVFTIQASTLSPVLNVQSSGSNMLCSAAYSALQTMAFSLPDPLFFAPWTFTGTNDYNATTRIEIEDKSNNFTANAKIEITQNAVVFFPADQKGKKTFKNADGSYNISEKNESYPLIIIVHGNGHFFRNYRPLADQLAKNGFIVAAVDCAFLGAASGTIKLETVPAAASKRSFKVLDVVFFIDTGTLKIFDNAGKPIPLKSPADFTLVTVSGTEFIKFTVAPLQHGMGGLGRAHLLFENLAYLETLFGAKVQLDNIGLIGHSRGGESVITAARDGANKINPHPEKYIIKSIISLAPSDQFDPENLTQDIPYFALYGSDDGDISGNRTDLPGFRGSAFTLWDRADNNSEKSMAFVYKASHNGFITKNSDDPTPFAPKKVGKLLPESALQKITKSYMSAFMRMTLEGETFWRPYFTGEQIPASVRLDTSDIFLQYKNNYNNATLKIDDFSNGNVMLTTHGDVVSYTNTPGAFQHVGFLRDMDDVSPHGTKGLEIKILSNTEVAISFNSALDISAYGFLSFRIALVVGFVADPLTFTVSIDGISSAASINIPKPRIRSDDFNTSKSAMNTVRIPLSSFSGISVNGIQKVSFLFTAPKESRIDIDDIEFTK